jgi:hypothetical protein
LRGQDGDRMRGWRGAEGNSSGLLELGLAGFLPVDRRQLGHLLVGRRGQALQHVFEIGIGFEGVEPAVLDQGIHHRATLPRFFGPEKQPVFLAMPSSA